MKFNISGGRKIEGTYRVQGNKNAALPLLAASLLSNAPVRLGNVPDIVDVQNMLRLMSATGAGVSSESGTVTLDPATLTSADLPSDIVHTLRGAILLLGSLAPKFEEISCSLPGGCPIGRRSFEMHWDVFRAAGFSVDEDLAGVRIRRQHSVPHPTVYLEEASVTATENALILFAALGGGTIENPAREPHVLSLACFLKKLGCEIELAPLHFTIRSGIRKGSGTLEFDVPGDYIDAGTMAIAAAVTRGRLELQGVSRPELLGIQPLLHKFGVEMVPVSERAWAVEAPRLESPRQLTAGLWPLFPTDLVSLAIVLATQSEGLCLIHDWMYEGRMFFVDKLVRMGADITVCDPHRVLVEGPARLRGSRLESPDIRAGMALVVAGLCAGGNTRIEHAEVIKRGYEKVVERLQGVGVAISEE